MYYDIAFCTLQDTIDFNDEKAPVKPACLPSQLDIEEGLNSKMCIATGFGTTSRDPATATASDHMMKAIVPLWQVNSCNKKYKKKLNGIHICAGGLGTDTCQGDSGGAMSCNIPRNNSVYEKCQGYFVRGLTSFGLGCNQIGTPGVYVDLSNKGIENWIKDIQRFLARKGVENLKPGTKYGIFEKNRDSYFLH
jgi:secreted trypsin-like serine protease